MESFELIEGETLPVRAADPRALFVLLVDAVDHGDHGKEPAAFVALAVAGEKEGDEIVPDAPPTAAAGDMGVLAGVLLCRAPDPGLAGPGAAASGFFVSEAETFQFCRACVEAGRDAAVAPHGVLIAGIARRAGSVPEKTPAALEAGRLLLRFVLSWAGSLRKEAPPAVAAGSPAPGLWLTASMQREADRLLGALAERTGHGPGHWMALQPVRRVLDSPASAKQRGKELLRTLRNLCLSAPSNPPRPLSALSALEGLRRVYVEEQALDRPATRAILASLEDRERIVIASYKSLLNRRRQAPSLQKNLLRAVVLGVKKGRFLYRQVRCSAPEGYAAWYASPVIGCLHQCRYCFVESKWGCGHLVVFVNHEDFVRSVIERLRQPAPAPRPWIAFGYDSELLAFSSFYPAVRALFDGLTGAAAGPEPGGVVEIITKSSSTHPFDARTPLHNLVVSFSLSPPEVWERFETGTAPPGARLGAAAELMGRGWKVGLRIDPVVPVRHCLELYSRLLRSLDSHLPLERLAFVQMGGLRFPESSGDRHYYRIAELGRSDYRSCLHDLGQLLPIRQDPT
jgi:spore photoproduct lyase